MFIRNCPQCGKELTYKRKNALNRAIKQNALCRSCAKKGKEVSEEHRRNLSEAHKGNTHSEETKRKMSIAKGGNGKLNQKWPGMKTWASHVKDRDNKRCVYCGSTKKLHAHHIIAKSKHPEWSLFVNNGITLCQSCHYEEHKINGCL